MAMGRFSAEVMESGVDPSGLGCWCWLTVGSGNKKTRIVMAYQPSGSKSTNSAGTTVREQHKRYFEARGNLRSVHTIFFEQLIAHLIVWKNSNSNIVLLGDFNENVYFGRFLKCLSQPDLMFREQCLQCTGIHTPPTTFSDGTIPIYALFATARIECVNTYILPHKEGMGNHRFFIVDFTLSSIMELNFPTLSGALHESYIANLPIWCSLIMPSWTCSAINTRCIKGYTSFTNT